MFEWLWPLSSHWRPPPFRLLVRGEIGYPLCILISATPFKPERSQNASLNFISNINWIHCWFLHSYPEFHSIIPSCCGLVAYKISPIFCSSRNLWSTLISFGSQGAWWIRDDVVHISSGLNILVFDSCVFVILLPGFQACVYAEGGEGGRNDYLNASKICPFGGCYGLLSFSFY